MFCSYKQKFHFRDSLSRQLSNYRFYGTLYQHYDYRKNVLDSIQQTLIKHWDKRIENCKKTIHDVIFYLASYFHILYIQTTKLIPPRTTELYHQKIHMSYSYQDNSCFLFPHNCLWHFFPYSVLFYLSSVNRCFFISPTYQLLFFVCPQTKVDSYILEQNTDNG